MSKKTSRRGSGVQPPTLYQHTMRRDWGLAVFAWEQGDHCSYLFEDGVLRTFHMGFRHLIEPVAVPCARHGEIERRLQGLVAEERQRRRSRKRPPVCSGIPFVEQLRLFIARYPDGFRDVRWLVRIRGEGRQQRRKRHREPALAAARHLLARTVLDSLHADARHHQTFAAALKVLRSTDLVPAAHLTGLENLAADQQRAWAVAVRDLLYGTDPYDERFDSWVATWRSVTGRPPSWQAATALPALIHPHEHLCVHPTSFVEQAKSMLPALDHAGEPSGREYRCWLSVAEGVQQACVARRLHPQDLLDIHDFVRQTLSRAARKRMAADRDRRDRHRRSAAGRRTKPAASTGASSRVHEVA